MGGNWIDSAIEVRRSRKTRDLDRLRRLRRLEVADTHLELIYSLPPLSLYLCRIRGLQQPTKFVEGMELQNFHVDSVW
jgi:hypothetical protein